MTEGIYIAQPAFVFENLHGYELQFLTITPDDFDDLATEEIKVRQDFSDVWLFDYLEKYVFFATLYDCWTRLLQALDLFATSLACNVVCFKKVVHLFISKRQFK